MVFYRSHKSFCRIYDVYMGLKMFQKIYDRVEDLQGYNAVDVQNFLNEIFSDLTEINNDLYLQRLSDLCDKIENKMELI